MIRIALLGSDSTHTEAFASRINKLDGPYYGVAKVTSIWGEDYDQANIKASALGIDRVSNTPAEALANADLAMVIGRFGESHFQTAMMAIEARIPTFVDKPFTVDIQQARNLATAAREQNVYLASASPLRFAKEVYELKAIISSRVGLKCVTASVPANCIDLGSDPRLNSSFFYGIHGLEVMFEIAGHDIADSHISYSKSAILVHLEFKIKKF